MKPFQDADLIALTADIVSAYVTKNAVPQADLPPLIAAIHAALQDLGGAEGPQAGDHPAPAVPVKKSITPDYIISLEDGRPYKSLKRHLRAQYGMTPEEYRAKWGLPPDYPMVAPNYAKARSDLAKSMGLGRKPQGASSGEAGSSRRARKADAL